MTRRGQGQMPNFDASFSRRPNNSAQNISSLLGEPPTSQSKNANYSKNPFASGNSGGGNYSDSFSRRESFGSGGGGQSFGGSGGGGGVSSGRSNQRLNDDFSGGGGRQGGSGGGGGGNFGQQNRFDQQSNNQQDAFGGSGWGQRPSSPNRFNNRGESPPIPRDRNPAWSTTQNSGMDFDNNAKQQHLLAQQNLFNAEISRFRDGGNVNNNAMQGLNMGQMNQMSQEQQGTPPVVMVMPQNQSGAAGMMGMMGANQNPFNVLAGQQRPMQVILGNLPAFNPDVFNQQLLQGVGGAFGQGMIPPNMGIMSQQQQPSQQFNRFNDNSGRSNYNNSSDRSSSSRGQGQNRNSSSNNMGNRSSSGRRSDSNSNNRNSDGRGGGIGGNNSTPSRDQRKRGGAVLRDPHPDEVADRKRAKHSGNQQNNKGNNNRNRNQQNRSANNVGGGNKNKKAQGNKHKTNDNKDKTKKIDGEEAEKEKKDVKDEKDEKKAEGATKDDEKAEGADTSTAEEETKEKQKEKKVSKYDEFPASLLVCKICQKVMNDGSSFESHLSGRAHLALVKILEQRFQKRTELLMQESKLAEDEIGVEMERQRRAGKNNQSGKNSKNYCKMCDCNYMVNWGTHKVSLGHRILKEFLHPTCRICEAHFVHRADWVNHLITLSHLRKLVELKNDGVDMSSHECATQDELFSVSIDMSSDDHITNAITIKPLETQISVKEDMSAMLNDGKDELSIPEGEIVIPETYDEAVAVGGEAIMTVAGSCCKVCRLYIADETEVEPHLKSKLHFNIYVAYLKQVVKTREQKAEEEKRAAEEAEKKAKKEKEDEIKKAADAEKAAKAEAEKADKEGKSAEVTKAEEEKSEEAEMDISEIKGDTAVNENLSVLETDKGAGENGAKDEEMDTSTAAEEKEEFVVEEEIRGDDEVTEVTTVEEAPVASPVKKDEKPADKKEAEVKAADKKEAETKPADIKAADKKPAPVASTPKPQERNNQNRGRGGARGTPGGRGRGGQTPSVNKPTARVDTNMRGGRGQNAGRSPRGGNQRGGNTGGGGNWRGGNRGGRGRPFNR